MGTRHWVDAVALGALILFSAFTACVVTRRPEKLSNSCPASPPQPPSAPDGEGAGDASDEPQPLSGATSEAGQGSFPPPPAPPGKSQGPDVTGEGSDQGTVGWQIDSPAPGNFFTNPDFG